MKRDYLGNAILITLIIVIITMLNWDISGLLPITLNDFLAIALLIFSVPFIFYDYTTGRYWLLVFLIIALTNLFVISYTIGNVTYSVKTVLNIGDISFNPFSFFLLFCYFLVDRKNLKHLISNTFFKSEQEEFAERDKMVKFYHDKFNKCSLEELLETYKIYPDYPEYAQIALNQIYKERKLFSINNL